MNVTSGFIKIIYRCLTYTVIAVFVSQSLLLAQVDVYSSSALAPLSSFTADPDREEEEEPAWLSPWHFLYGIVTDEGLDFSRPDLNILARIDVTTDEYGLFMTLRPNCTPVQFIEQFAEMVGIYGVDKFNSVINKYRCQETQGRRGRVVRQDLSESDSEKLPGAVRALRKLLPECRLENYDDRTKMLLRETPVVESDISGLLFSGERLRQADIVAAAFDCLYRYGATAFCRAYEKHGFSRIVLTPKVPEADRAELGPLLARFHLTHIDAQDALAMGTVRNLAEIAVKFKYLAALRGVKIIKVVNQCGLGSVLEALFLRYSTDVLIDRDTFCKVLMPTPPGQEGTIWELVQGGYPNQLNGAESDVARQFVRFQSCNYKCLKLIRSDQISVGNVLEALALMEEMIRIHLYITRGINLKSDFDTRGCPEAVVYTGIRERMLGILKKHLQVADMARITTAQGNALLSEDLRRALWGTFDGTKTAGYIADRNMLGRHAREGTILYFEEFLNIVHQRVLADVYQMVSEVSWVSNLSFKKLATTTTTHSRSWVYEHLLPYTDLRGNIQRGISVPVQVMAHSLGAHIRNDPRINPFVIALSDREATAEIQLGEHGMRLYYHAGMPDQGGRFSFEYSEKMFGSSLMYDSGSWCRVRVIKRFCEKLGMAVQFHNNRLEAVYDKDTGAVGASQVQEMVYSVLQLLNSTSCMDETLNSVVPADDALTNALIDKIADFCIANGVMEEIVLTKYVDCYLILRAMGGGKIGYDFMKEVMRGDSYRAMADSVAGTMRGLGLDVSGDIFMGQPVLDRWMTLIDDEIRHGRLVYDQQGNLIKNSAYETGRNDPIGYFIRLLSDNSYMPALMENARIAAAVGECGIQETAGYIGGYAVQKISLDTIGGKISFYCLRHEADGAVHAAYAVFGDAPVPGIRYLPEFIPRIFNDNILLDPEQIRDVLNLYCVQGEESNAVAGGINAEMVKSIITKPRRLPIPISPVFAPGIAASGGLVSGFFKMDSGGLTPAQFQNCILAGRCLKPEDDPKICACKGIITLGGGINTHANALAREKQKPVLIIPDGSISEKGTLRIPYKEHTAVSRREQRIELFGVEVTYYSQEGHHDVTGFEIQDNDLVLLDAENGRLYWIGRGPKTVKLAGLVYDLIAGVTDSERQRALGGIEKYLDNAGTDDSAMLHFIILELLKNIYSVDGNTIHDLLRAAYSNKRVKEIVEGYLLRFIEEEIKAAQEYLAASGEIIRTSEIYDELRYRVYSCEHKVAALKQIIAVTKKQDDISITELEEQINEVNVEAQRRVYWLREKLKLELDGVLEDAGTDISGNVYFYQRLLDQAKELGLAVEEEYGRLISEIARVTAERPEPYVLKKGDIDASYRDLCGGKAANSGTVQKIVESSNIPGVTVPRGIAVTRRVYRESVEGSEIAFVCSGNTCRSPLAAGYALRLLEKMRLDGLISVKSYGTAVRVPQPAAEFSQTIAEENDFSRLLTNHRSTQITRDDLYRLDHIFVMEELHKRTLLSLCGDDAQIAAKITVLGVDDPSGSELDVYRRTFMSIKDLLDRNLMQWIGKYRKNSGVEDEIISSVTNISSVSGLVAVRSSGMEEDSREQSLAGQRTTQLCVILGEGIWKSLEAVWRSGAQAALIEEMADVEVSGVAYSMDPATMDFRKTVINAAFGLGEWIASDIVSDPDVIVVDKNYGAVIGYHQGSKEKKVVPKLDGGTEVVDIEEEGRRRQTLTRTQALRLHDIVKEIEKYYGYPVDVEFAIDNAGNIVILQARPVAHIQGCIKNGGLIPLMATTPTAVTAEPEINPALISI